MTHRGGVVEACGHFPVDVGAVTVNTGGFLGEGREGLLVLQWMWRSHDNTKGT